MPPEEQICYLLQGSAFSERLTARFLLLKQHRKNWRKRREGRKEEERQGKETGSREGLERCTVAPFTAALDGVRAGGRGGLVSCFSLHSGFSLGSVGKGNTRLIPLPGEGH